MMLSPGTEDRSGLQPLGSTPDDTRGDAPGWYSGGLPALKRWQMFPQLDYEEGFRLVTRPDPTRPTGGGAIATKWKDVKHKAAPEVRERVKHEALAEYAEMQRAGVGALRMARKLTQVAVAEQMNVTQSVVSRLESQKDWNLSTLRKYVSAMGGRLELRAVFPDDEMEVDSLIGEEALAVK